MSDFEDDDDEFLTSIDLDITVPGEGSPNFNGGHCKNSSGSKVHPTEKLQSTQGNGSFDEDEDDDQLLCSICLDDDDALPTKDGPQTMLNTGSETESLNTQPDDKINVPSDFPFPFTPYDIQTGFMQELYKCLELGKLGIFESPTGTGKSLSLICGALKWLRDFKEKQREELEALLELNQQSAEKENKMSNTTTNNTELDWITGFKQKQEGEEKTKLLREELEKRSQRETRLKEARSSRRCHGKRKRTQAEDEFDELMKSASKDIQEAYRSEKEQLDQEESGLDNEDDQLVLAEYHSDEDSPDKEEDKVEEEVVHCTKIYFCSRTHSQLSQFVREVIKSPYGEDTRVVSLGSRQNLCINEAVRKLKSLSLINDTCRDLQKKKSQKKKDTENPTVKKRKSIPAAGCPYYKQDPIKDFGDQALVEVKDIEQLVSLGRRLKACPYYGTRLAIPDAEIVALPYNTLLHKPTREASGIRLKGNIVIVDEAHNLLETINNIHSTEVTGAQLVRAHSQLSQYERKYRSRLKAQNLMYIKQILYILSSLTKVLGGNVKNAAEKQTSSVVDAKLWTINDFLFHSQLDNMNLFKVLRYCEKSLISRKLQGFVEKYPEEAVRQESEKKVETALSSMSSFLKSISEKGDNSSSQNTAPQPAVPEGKALVLNSPLMHIEGFLLALTNADKDGRIVITKQGLLSQSSIKFLLLNPAVYFSDVVSEARAVIVAGGTMQPVSDFKDQLFHAVGVKPERVLEYSCGHVIPGEQLLPIALSNGPSDIQLDFTFQNRNRPSLLDELGRLVTNVCNVVPGGVICFFPSYDYEKQVYAHWEKTGTINKLSRKKKVFREPRRAGQVDQVLSEYTACIQKCDSIDSTGLTGSVLFCVVGGKMSEGINFSDELGRCVMMIGMPYPNINSPELKEKMVYLNTNFPRNADGKLPGQIHYENLCMKAVNQSIGRAIRHLGDYATILLLDRRYGRPATISKLPGWISKHLVKAEKFNTAFSSISKFFTRKT